ncbi:RNA polymerase sigma factor [Microbacterium sp. M28]|uniref:RNA polymerase sigma factor n=1 Tax=Microbacterium sp. M28 TaxID=2962064 RepID=UPI0039A4AE73
MSSAWWTDSDPRHGYGDADDGDTSGGRRRRVDRDACSGWGHCRVRGPRTPLRADDAGSYASAARGSADVDDIVQDTFVVAWQRLDELDDPAAVRSWLMRIVSRRAMDRLRATRPHLDVDDLDHAAPAETAPPRIVEARARAAALDAVLAELPEAQRQCWILRELGGQSYEEIADELAVPASTVRGLLARARKYIIVRMEQWR